MLSRALPAQAKAYTHANVAIKMLAVASLQILFICCLLLGLPQAIGSTRIVGYAEICTAYCLLLRVMTGVGENGVTLSLRVNC